MAKLRPPTRTLHNRGHRRLVGQPPSRKNGGAVPWEFQLERDLFYYLEYRRDVVRYQCQPKCFDIWIDGRKASYTPDAEIVFDDGRIAYGEAKTARAACKPEWQARQYAATEALQATGHDLMVLTEHDLRPRHWAQNIRILYPYAGHPKFEDAKARIPGILGRAARAEIAQVRETANLLGFDAVAWRTSYTCATPDSVAQCRP